jgi:hypothetical protein
MREPRSLTTLWASTACYKGSFTFYYFFLSSIENRLIILHSFALRCLVFRMAENFTSDGVKSVVTRAAQHKKPTKSS